MTGFHQAIETLTVVLSLLLMGTCGVKLLARLYRVLRGTECVRESAVPRAVGMRTLLRVALLTLASRLALFVLAYAMYRLFAAGEDGFLASLESLWVHWDVRHYLGIAESGYTAVGDERLRLVFFPLYPLLMRLFSPLTGGNLFLSGTLISLLCASLSGALLYDLAVLLGAERAVAQRALAYFLLSPLSVFLCCAYSEALFVCLTLAVMVLLRRDRPWLAAFCGAASAFTRMPGLIVCGLFLIRLLYRWPRRDSNRAFGRAALACAAQMALVFCGFAAYLVINRVVTGSPTTFLTYQAENWYQRPGSFWASTANTVHYFLTSAGSDDWLFTWGFQLLCMVYAYALLAFRQDRLPFDLAAYSFVYVAVVFAPTWLLSGARYLYAMATLPLLQARAHDRAQAHAAALCVCAVLLIIWTFGYTLAVEVL